MEIIIKADGTIKGQVIGNYIISGKTILNRFIDFASELKPKRIYVVKHKSRDIKDTRIKIIPLDNINKIKDAVILNLDYVYDGRLLKKLILKKKDPKKAIITRNERREYLKSFEGLYFRKEWNPISQYYIEPIGEKLAYLIKDTKITPNLITITNIILSVAASALLFYGGIWNILLFVLWVRLFHILDVMDGRLAKLKCTETIYGKWIDGGGDKLILNSWIIAAALAVFVRTNSNIYLIIALFLLLGEYMYNYLSLTAAYYYGNGNLNHTVKSNIKGNLLAKIFMFFANADIKLYMISIFPLINKLDWFLIFYCIHFNLSWLAYVAYYSYDHLRNIKKVN